jgi:hypothetical protein
MPRQALQNIENSFVNGLVSQATGLNFPEKACTDTDNCIFWETGTVTRRLGIDFEPQFVSKTVTRTDNAMSTFVWKNVADDANTTLIVQQVGDTLYFWDAISFANISLGAITDTVDLNDFTPVGGSIAPDRFECQFANGHGVLFVFHPYCDPFYVEYDPNTQTFTATEINIQIRDFEGELTDILSLISRPVTTFAGMTDQHHYNLLNQGWNDTNLQAWDAARGDMPSNADIMYLFKNSTNVFDASTVANVIQGNTPAPKGHYILNVFNQDRITASGISNLTTNTTGALRMATGAFFSGRVWYSGINAQSFKGSVYFSPVIESFTEFGQCYQQNDPTAEDFFDLLPTDGGVINIADAGTVYRLFATQSSLLVFASNGVWSITGSTGVGFTANDYSVSKLTDIPTISGSSFVNVAGYPVWWNYDGIYTIVPDQTGGFTPKNLTENSIKDFYQLDIPDESKLFAKGCYNNILKTVQWVYRDSTASDIKDNYNYNRVLTLNLNTNAWYPWSVPEADPRLNGIFFVESVPETIEILDVVDGSGNFVVDGSGNQVIVYSKSGIITPRNVFVTTADFSGTIKLQFALATDSDYQDWGSYSAGPLDYSSYFVTGYKIHAQAQKKFQTNYMFIYSNTEADTSYKIRGIWDYATNALSNRFSTQQTITHTDNNYAYSHKKIKIRGNGLALQFRVDSNGNDPFEIIGWSLFETANSLP